MKHQPSIGGLALRFDIVIPAHNEERRIDRTLRAYRAVCSKDEIRFLVAADSCTDSTCAIVRRHAAEDPRVSLLEYPKLGKGGVITETFARSDAELIGFVDADGATPPAEMLRLADVARDADGAIASRRHPAALVPVRRSLGRRVLSRGFAHGTRRLMKLPYGDTQCGAKVLRREVVEAILPRLAVRDLMFDVDLLVVAGDLGFRIVEVPTIWIDQEGSRVRPVADTSRMGASLARLWVHQRLRRPAKAATPPDVALITPYPRAGATHEGRSGVASYSAALARALADQGASVSVLAPEEDGEPVVSSDGPIRVERRFQRGATALPKAALAAQATGAPAVHLQHETFLYGGPASVPGLVPALGALRGAGRATVVTMHHVIDPATVDKDFVRMHRVRAPVAAVRSALAGVQAAVRRLASTVVVHEPAFRKIVPEARVVPHGVEPVPRPDRDSARASLGLDGELVALCFGFLAPYKGLETALEAAALTDDGVKVVVAGAEHPRLVEAEDNYGASLRALSGDRVTFTGHVPEPQVSQWFAAADVALFLYPRPFAASGPFAIALGHETPALMSPAMAVCTGAPSELAVALDPGAVAERLQQLAGDEAQRERLRTHSARLARERSWPNVADRLLDVYDEVAA